MEFKLFASFANSWTGIMPMDIEFQQLLALDLHFLSHLVCPLRCEPIFITISYILYFVDLEFFDLDLVFFVGFALFLPPCLSHL